MALSTIRRGSSGLDVATWQKVIGLSPDSFFGPATETITKSWQAKRGLVADGIVGPKTWAAAGLVQTEPPPSSGAIRFVQAKNFTRASRDSQQILGLAVHTAECQEIPAAAENVASWFAMQPAHGSFVDHKLRPLAKDAGGKRFDGTSAHYMVDVDSITQSVRDEDIAWHAGPANGWSIGIEHAGRAKQTAADWADPYSIAVLERSAELAAGLCARWGIPVRRLTADDLARGERRGIFGHVDVTRGLKSGSHVDPGEAFPWDWYLERVQHHLDVRARPSLRTSPDGLVGVDYAGETWLVQPTPSAFCSIGEAVEAAKRAGCELPSPGLVDAIWRAADLRILPAVQSHDGTFASMNAPSTYAKVTEAVERALSGRIVGSDVKLVAGAWKDVAVKNGKVGLYGAHVGDVAAFRSRHGGIPLHAPETPGDGLIVQQFYAGHALGWRDYLQSYRLCRRKK